MNPGKYIGVVVETKLTWSTRGTLGVGILFEVETSPEKKEPIWATVWVTDGSSNVARKSLSAVGFDVDHEDLSILTDDKFRLMGHKAEIEIESEEYNGKPSLKVKWINPIRSPEDSKAKISAATKMLRAAKKAGNAGVPEEEGGGIPF